MNFAGFLKAIDDMNRRYDDPTPQEAQENADDAAKTFGLFMRRWNAKTPLPKWLLGFKGAIDRSGRAYVDASVAAPRFLNCLPRVIHGLPVVARVVRAEAGLGQLVAGAPQVDWPGWIDRLEGAGGKGLDSGKPEDIGVLASTAGVLKATAVAAGAMPVALAAERTMAAGATAVKKPGDADALANVRLALADALETVRREAIATVEDRIRAEETLDRRMDRFEDRLRVWKSEHSGIGALVDAIKGGADVGPLQAELKAIKDAVDGTPLTREGRRRLLERHDQIAPEVKAGDWKLLAIGGIGIISWQVIASGAGAAAKAGVTYAAETRKRKKKSAAKKKKRKSED